MEDNIFDKFKESSSLDGDHSMDNNHWDDLANRMNDDLDMSRPVFFGWRLFASIALALLLGSVILVWSYVSKSQRLNQELSKQLTEKNDTVYLNKYIVKVDTIWRDRFIDRIDTIYFAKREIFDYRPLATLNAGKLFQENAPFNKFVSSPTVDYLNKDYKSSKIVIPFEQNHRYTNIEFPFIDELPLSIFKIFEDTGDAKSSDYNSSLVSKVHNRMFTDGIYIGTNTNGGIVLDENIKWISNVGLGLVAEIPIFDRIRLVANINKHLFSESSNRYPSHWDLDFSGISLEEYKFSSYLLYNKGINYSLGAKYFPFDFKRVSPFLGFGLGGAFSRNSEANFYFENIFTQDELRVDIEEFERKSLNDIFSKASFGLEYTFSKRWHLQASLNYYYMKKAQKSIIDLGGGVLYHF